MVTNIKETLVLLSKPVWTYKEIMKYFGCKRTKANQIRLFIIEQGGGVQYGKQFVKTDDCLRLYGTSRDDEIAKLSVLSSVEDRNEEV